MERTVSDESIFRTYLDVIIAIAILEFNGMLKENPKMMPAFSVMGISKKLRRKYHAVRPVLEKFLEKKCLAKYEWDEDLLPWYRLTDDGRNAFEGELRRLYSHLGGLFNRQNV